jgi:omega-6 fatty acid desaturase (delta-12 desaturase)
MDTKNIVITTLKKFEVSNDQKSFLIYLFTLIALIGSVSASIFSYTLNPWLPVLFIAPSGFLLCRFFVMQHDCGHYSFFTKRSYNQLAGLIMGFFTMIPSSLWNHIHNVHHGVVGNLAKRNINPELWTMTVQEYKNANLAKRIAYRIMRSIVMRLFVTPIIWILAPRIPLPHLGIKIFSSIVIHDIIYAVILYFILVNDLFLVFTLTYLIPLYFFNFTASIFFYLQHQYEDTIWEEEKNWDLYKASIDGSSHLVVGKFMGWVSGNVGCHHIHHLNTKIPSYLLHTATENANQYLEIEPIYLNQLFHHLRCALWDEDTNKLIPIRNISKERKN